MDGSAILQIILEFAGGLGLFLFGMKMMSDSLEKIAGSKLRKLLDALTSNRFLGVLVGALFTMVIQSSSATTVMVVGFVNAQLMSLIQAAGVIMGANIGTTITAQLIAFKLTKLAPAFLFLGVALVFFGKKKKVANYGMAATGFGMLFLGMAMMSSAMKPLRSMPAITNILLSFENPVLGVLAGAALTALIQSSSASIGILQAMASQGLIGLQGAAFIVLGQNIGTCITALLACIGTNKNAKRAAIIHLLFNILGTVIFILIIQIVPVVPWLSTLSPGEPMRQIAWFHTIFNISMTLLLVPFARYLVWMAKRLVPGEDAVTEPEKLMFLEENMFTTPPIAVIQIQKEVRRMADIAIDNIKDAVQAFIKQDGKLMENVYQREKVIDYLNHEITRNLVKINQLEISKDDKELIGSLFHVVTDLERVGDHAENIVEFAEVRRDYKLPFSDTAMEELQGMSGRVVNLLELSARIMDERDAEAAKNVAPLEQEIDDLEKMLRSTHIERLNEAKCTPRSGTIFIEIISNLERVADHSTNVAYSVLEDG